MIHSAKCIPSKATTHNKPLPIRKAILKEIALESNTQK